MLEGFQGYLTADAYVAYERIGRLWPDVIKASCWVHGRRKFEACHHRGATPQTRSALAYFRQREEFLRQFEKLYRQMCAGEVIRIYFDEAHFHRDLDLGFSWGRKGERLWRLSDCPGLSEKINWYGAYNFTQGRCLIWNEGRCNSASTVSFSSALRNGWGTPIVR